MTSVYVSIFGLRLSAVMSLLLQFTALPLGLKSERLEVLILYLVFCSLWLGVSIYCNIGHPAVFHGLGKYILALNLVPITLLLWGLIYVLKLNSLLCSVAGIPVAAMIGYIVATRNRYNELREKVDQEKEKEKRKTNK